MYWNGIILEFFPISEKPYLCLPKQVFESFYFVMNEITNFTEVTVSFIVGESL